jgi:hypothetical protein
MVGCLPGAGVPVVDHFRRDVRDQVLWHPVHRAGQGVEVGLGVTASAAAHSERPLGKRREGGVRGIERILELLRRIGHGHMLGAGHLGPVDDPQPGAVMLAAQHLDPHAGVIG